MTPDAQLDPKSLRVVDLKKELQARNLPTKGQHISSETAFTKHVKKLDKCMSVSHTNHALSKQHTPLTISGRKADLVARLEEYLEQ
eukprot:1246758-Amorphochlora_amoeboformis.AAC.1